MPEIIKIEDGNGLLITPFIKRNTSKRCSRNMGNIRSSKGRNKENIERNIMDR